MGGGPTRMMLAGKLALVGIDVAIVEPRTTRHVDGSRTGGLHASTVEFFDQRGIAERFVSAGKQPQMAEQVQTHSHWLDRSTWYTDSQSLKGSSQ